MLKLASLEDIASYHNDTEESLKHYYSPFYSGYASRFTTYLPSEVFDELATRVGETERRSVLVVLARVEAAFRRDYNARATSKSADPLSIAFRKLYSKRGKNARFEDEILDEWRQQLSPPGRQTISELRGMFKYRHWLAHGRYWNLGRPYSYQDVYLLADVVLSSLPLQG